MTSAAVGSHGSAMAAKPRRRHVLWWIYYGWYLLQIIASPVMVVLAATPPTRVLVVQILFELIGVAGYFCFLKFIPFMSRAFWTVYMVIWTGRGVFAASLFARALFAFGGWRGSHENYVSLLGLAGILSSLPTLAALVIYTYRTPGIWQADRA